MKTLTIRGLPDEVHGRLKERAEKNRRSLNQEIIAELCNTEKPKKDFVEGILAEADAIYNQVSQPLSPKEVQEAMDEVRER